MTTAATSLLGLALPVTGELSGTWGDTVNNSITSLLDTAVAGTTTLSTDADVTLTTTTLASNQARQAILLCSGARTALRTITAPAQSKIYTIINATTGGYSVKLVGVGPTTGLTIPNGASAVVAWNGSDFIEVGSATVGNLTVNGNLSVTGTTSLTGVATLTANPVLSAGTANGVAYLNGSKSLTTGSVLTFDGAILGVNGVSVGRGAGAVSTNTAVGASALAANTSGDYTTALGTEALGSNTSGVRNTAVGRRSLYTNTTGGYNSALGMGALYANSTGSYNTAVGQDALTSNTTASYNTAVGFQAGYSNTTGIHITALGSGAAYGVTTGNDVTALGYLAGNGNTTGYGNTYVGSYAGQLITTGYNNTILGSFQGNSGGLDIRTAHNYIVLSDGDGNPRGVFNGSGNFYLKQVASIGANGGNMEIYSSDNYNSAPNLALNVGTNNTGGIYLYFTNAAGTKIGSVTQASSTSVAYNTTSDYRLKDNIQPMVGALARVQALRPVTYTWKEDGSDGEGFIAHELQSVISKAVTGNKDEVDASGRPNYQSVDNSFLVATLTAAIKEQQAIIETLTARITALEGK